MFDDLYIPYPEEKEVFGDKWCGPAKYPKRDSVLIAKYPKTPEDGDGQPVEVYGSAAGPARFYTAKVLPWANSAGEMKDGFEVSTGSGNEMAKLIKRIAIAISEGMIDFSPSNQATAPDAGNGGADNQ